MTSPAELGADLACRRTLDHVAAPVWVWVPGPGVVYVNRAWLDLTGSTLEDNTGDGWLRFIHEDDRSAVQTALGEPRSASGDHRDYRVHSRSGKPVAVTDRSSAWADEATHRIQVVHTLIPHVSEEDRAKAMSRWAHELRGPLNAILGWSDLLGAGDSAADVVQRGLKAIANNARQQAQIIKRMTE